MTKTDAKQLVNRIAEKVRSKYNPLPVEKTGGYQVGFLGPNVKVENTVETPNVHVKNNVPTPNVKVFNQVETPKVDVTVTTKDMADMLGGQIAALLADLVGKVETLTKAIVRLAERPAPIVSVPSPPDRPKSLRLETDHDGIRRAVPEY